MTDYAKVLADALFKTDYPHDDFDKFKPGHLVYNRYLKLAETALAYDALSRAPQPDTVTELVKRDCMNSDKCGFPECGCTVAIDARALTAVLAVSKKT